MARESQSQRIAGMVGKRFPALTGQSAKELVRFILAKRNAIERAKNRVGDDTRDYLNTAVFISKLSKKELSEISHLSRGDIRHRLKEKIYPFTHLSRKTREKLMHLPNSWICGAAEGLLHHR